MIRKLYLKNEKGVRFDFDYISGVLLSNLDGLGFQHDTTYLKYGAFYDLVKRDQPITKITGLLTFLSGYKGYSTFLSYLRSSEKLELHYTSEGTKYCYIEIERLDKKELVMGSLQSQITIEKLTPWLRTSSLILDLDEDYSGKIYPHSYPHTYSITFQGKTQLSNHGDYKAPLRIEIIGTVDEPEVNIIKGGAVVSSLRLELASSNCEIVIDANPIEQIMKIKENGVSRDIYQDQDFTKDNFLFLDVGTFDIEFKPGVSTNTLCRITMTEVFVGH
ncbi:MAG: hypothetical protein RG740_00940 [Acholeplasmataceae bacterium]|nr:hypothetical protein [Acholeplasmataceae bacterium]